MPVSIFHRKMGGKYWTAPRIFLKLNVREYGTLGPPAYRPKRRQSALVEFFAVDVGDSLMRNFLTIGTSLVVAIALSAWPNTAVAAVFDNFSDLNDTVNPTWTHLDGLAASTGQTWDASTGQYRMTAQNNGFSNLGFVGSYVRRNRSAM